MPDPPLGPHELIVPNETDPVEELRLAIGGNADKLKQAVLYDQGAIGSRPAAGVAGREYRSTDETPPVRYRDTGTGWEPQSPDLAVGAFHAYRAGAASYANGAAIVWDTEAYDLSSWFDTATGRFTPQVAGVYRFSWIVTTPVSSLAIDQWMSSQLRKNAVTPIADGSIDVQTSSLTCSSVGTVSHLANGTTDYFQVIVTHNKGSALAVTANNPQALHFCGELIGRTA